MLFNYIKMSSCCDEILSLSVVRVFDCPQEEFDPNLLNNIEIGAEVEVIEELNDPQKAPFGPKNLETVHFIAKREGRSEEKQVKRQRKKPLSQQKYTFL